MSGTYSGVQARIMEVNDKAVYVPCMAHSLNLSTAAAAESCIEALNFFGFVNKIYVFLSASTQRWSILMDGIEITESEDPDASKLVPKRHSDIRWSARADALRSLSSNYQTFKHVLEDISTNIQRKPDIKNEASALVDVMEKLETGIMTAFWYKVLNRINDNSKILQSGTIDLTTAVKLLQSLSEFLVSQRSQFNDYLKKGHFVFWE